VKVPSFKLVMSLLFKLMLSLKSLMMELDVMFISTKNFINPSIFFLDSNVMDNLISDLTLLLVKKSSGEKFIMFKSSMKHSMLNLLKRCSTPSRKSLVLKLELMLP